MKLSLKNLGRIREAELDLRPLTIFVGENSTNKTWTSVGLWSLLSTLSNSLIDIALARRPLRHGYLAWHYDQPVSPLDDVIAQRVSEFVDAIGDSFPLQHEIRGTFDWRPIAETLPAGATVARSREGFGEILGVNEDILGYPELTLALTDQDINKLRPTIAFARIAPWLATAYKPHQPRNPNHSIDVTVTSGTSKTQIKDTLSRLIRESLGNIYSHTALFPVERTLEVDLFRGDEYGRESILPGYLSHFIDTARLASSFASQKESDFWKAHKLDAILSKLIRGAMHSRDGKAEYEAEGFSAVRVAASPSIVKSLSSIVMYLKGFADPYGAILIDEPEMNAHPSAQLAIAELLCLLANAGIQVVVSTHTPYLVEHLNTLMAGSRLEGSEREELVSRLKLGDDRALIEPTNVSVFEFCEESGVVVPRSVLDRTDGIVETDTFSRQTNYLNETYPISW